MKLRLWLGMLALGTLAVASANAEITGGVMVVTGAEMK
jgi:hypothetical protein